jgi:Na+/H+ antiporter NhaD/arsenite permease-like protein
MRRVEPKELVVPVIAVAAGVAYLVAGLVSGNTGFGIAGLVVMLVFAAVIWLVRRRSETVQGLLDRRDERINAIDLKATAFAGSILLVAVIVAFVVDIARGGDGAPYFWLAAIAGIASLAAVLVQRLRG